MSNWTLMQDICEEYYVALDSSDSKSVVFKVSEEEATKIIEKTGCEVERIPF